MPPPSGQSQSSASRPAVLRRALSPRTKGKDLPVDELVAKLQDLEKFKIDEEKTRKKDEKQKQKELELARKKLSRQIAQTKGNLKKRSSEAGKLRQSLQKLEKQQLDSSKHKTATAQKIEEKIHRFEDKHNSTEVDLHDKLSQVSEASGLLAYLEYAQEMLDQGVILGTDPKAALTASSPENASLLDTEASTLASTDATRITEAMSKEMLEMRVRLREAEARVQGTTGKFESEELARLRRENSELRKENQELRARMNSQVYPASPSSQWMPSPAPMSRPSMVSHPPVITLNPTVASPGSQATVRMPTPIRHSFGAPGTSGRHVPPPPAGGALGSPYPTLCAGVAVSSDAQRQLPGPKDSLPHTPRLQSTPGSTSVPAGPLQMTASSRSSSVIRVLSPSVPTYKVQATQVRASSLPRSASPVSAPLAPMNGAGPMTPQAVISLSDKVVGISLSEGVAGASTIFPGVQAQPASSQTLPASSSNRQMPSRLASAPPRSLSPPFSTLSVSATAPGISASAVGSTASPSPILSAAAAPPASAVTTSVPSENSALPMEPVTAACSSSASLAGMVASLSTADSSNSRADNMHFREAVSKVTAKAL
eukprot:CAMPEP_0197641468 /NCGR_PEP_ID=MMETSP1338-20131121/15430_1 /TAXON_ID=43686 ORGANISM="Pelagodinium beii, Strain RCC1491" /NCGR_SAMPLE_ID=MMETSP1338 /ASSEMBLY_ACC=CAM_ASM_000754 /LENGTH=597 /DNA_ID=CAMNT_0043214461 /DNA_START=78 /DNA_END=1868 /DNA_ORIENTATION=-